MGVRFVCYLIFIRVKKHSSGVGLGRNHWARKETPWYKWKFLLEKVPTIFKKLPTFQKKKKFRTFSCEKNLYSGPHFVLFRTVQ